MLPQEELHLEYPKAVRAFRGSLRAAIEFHAKMRNAPLEGIGPTVRLMFARIMLVAGSISRLIPDIERESLWDFTSIALLARGLFESVLFFRYFTAPAGPDEWFVRMLVLNLHDRCERIRMFQRLQKPEDVAGFEGEAAEIRDILRQNEFFQGLDQQRQADLLNGSRASLLKLNEMGERYAPGEETWIVFQLLSHYTHGHPMSFMRNDDERRDGLPNDKDKTYIAGVLTWLASALEGATNAYGEIPAAFAVTKEILNNFDLTNVSDTAESTSNKD